MLEKFKVPRPLPDQPGRSVIRHRHPFRLNERRQQLAALAVTLAFVMVATLGNISAVGGSPNVTNANQATTQVGAALAERETAVDRTDRFERSQPQPETFARAVLPEESPEPEPEPVDTTEDSDEATGEEAADGPKDEWVHPMPDGRTTSCYGQRWGRLHAGVDLAAPHGTPIYAVGAGTVTQAGWDHGGYGISVTVDHGDGYHTLYAHASEAKVSVGDEVSAGDTIALEGTTGNSTGPHLHFEVHDGPWSQIEPTSWMSDRDVTIGGC